MEEMCLQSFYTWGSEVSQEELPGCESGWILSFACHMPSCLGQAASGNTLCPQLAQDTGSPIQWEAQEKNKKPSKENKQILHFQGSVEDPGVGRMGYAVDVHGRKEGSGFPEEFYKTFFFSICFLDMPGLNLILENIRH